MKNYAFDLAFEVVSDKSADDITADELWAGLAQRIANLRKEGNQSILEACGAPYDEYEDEKPKTEKHDWECFCRECRNHLHE